MKIVMIEPIAVNKEQAEKIFKKVISQGHEFVYCDKPLSLDEKIERAKDADALIVANAPLDQEVILQANKLKLISVAFTGVDHIPMELCRQKNILVCNAQGYCTNAVAELTFGLVLNCIRNILICDSLTRSEKTKAGFVGNELFGKTFGVVGTGAIGICVAKIAKAFGCKVLGYDKFQKEAAVEAGIEYTDLNTLLETSDIVTLHVPLTPETKHLIHSENLKLMKPTAILVNVARGDVVDNQALANALNEGKLRGAGIDVFEIEPPIAADHPLLHSKNTVVTPHVAFATQESMISRAKIVCENVEAWLDGSPINLK